MAILRIEALTYFDDAGALEKVKAVVMTDAVGRVAVVLNKAEVDLTLDAQGDISAKTALKAALRTKARSIIAARRTAQQAASDKQTADAARRAKIVLNVQPSDL